MDLTEAEDIKRWQEHTEELHTHTQNPNDPDTTKVNHSPRPRHPGMWSQVGFRQHHYKQSLWRWWNSSYLKLEIQILKDDAVKVLHSICQQIWKTEQWSQDCKRSAFIQILKKGNAKEYSNYCIIVLISHTRKVMLRILQARLQQYVNHELPDIQYGF